MLETMASDSIGKRTLGREISGMCDLISGQRGTMEPVPRGSWLRDRRRSESWRDPEGTWRDAQTGRGGSERSVKRSVCVHRPDGGEVSTLPSAATTEHVSHQLAPEMGGKTPGGASMLARLRRNPCLPRARNRRVLATRFRNDLRYMRPESNGKSNVKTRYDVYTLGESTRIGRSRERPSSC